MSIILVVAIVEASGSSMGSHYVCCRKSYIRDKSGRCQCPLTGNYHFYFGDGGWTITGRNWCQCPLTGNHHFYVTISLEKAIACCKVSMPSNGQPSFLLPRVCGQGNAPGMCQCPLTGNHHFYPTPQNILILCGFPASISEVFF